MTPSTNAVPSATGNVVVDLAAWLAGGVPHSQWRRLTASKMVPPAEGSLPPRDSHLAHKYIGKWRERVCYAHILPTAPVDDPCDPTGCASFLYECRCCFQTMMSHGMRPLSLEAGGWLKPVLFDPSSRIARDTACQMLRSLCDSYERTKAVSLS